MSAAFCIIDVPADTVQLLVLDPEKRLPLDEVQAHPWIIKHCVKGERASNREKPVI